METEFGAQIEAFRIHTDSGGPGFHRGGCGIIRDIRVLAEEATLGLRLDNCKFPAYGVKGGKSGSPGKIIVNPGTPEERILRTMSDGNIVRKDDIIRIVTAGGGGWGDPLEREPERVLDDVLDGFVSVGAAQDSYGVVIDPDTLVIDPRATASKRQELKNSRGPTKLFHRFEYFDTAEEELEWVTENIPR